jgi:putative Mg2+ transporter-C (MgtC) family protein
MLDILFKLFLALIIGGLIGYERELQEKSAGLRTITLVCLGSTLFTVFSTLFDPIRGDPSRVAASIVAGIGFLGAGVILREKGQVWGLTTAAIVWLAAALGMGIGIGEYLTVCIATVAALAVLFGFPRISFMIKSRDTYRYEVVMPLDEAKFQEMAKGFDEEGLTLTKQVLAKKGNKLIISWEAYGNSSSHLDMMRRFMSDPLVEEFEIL